MDKVKKPSNSEYYKPSSEPFRIYTLLFVYKLMALTIFDEECKLMSS
jgi:hypothetical protein